MKTSGAFEYLRAPAQCTGFYRFEISNSFKYAVPAALWGFTNNIAFYQYVLDPAAVTVWPVVGSLASYSALQVLQNMKIPVTAILLKA